MSYASIDDLRESLASKAPAHLQTNTPEYNAKMMHDIPKTTVVKREESVLAHCKGKKVLEFGATGPLHEAVVKVAAGVTGIDRETTADTKGFDLDNVAYAQLPVYGGVSDATTGMAVVQPDIILCGEVLEHLANPGFFLQRLKAQFPGIPVIITVPNAFTDIGRKLLQRGIENVNVDHVSWYSYRTLKTLVERYGFEIEAFHWYNGEPYYSEGMLLVVR